MFKLKCFLIFLISWFSVTGIASAQVDIGAGINVGYPHLFNKLGNTDYRQYSSIGVVAGVAYKFGDSYFYPALSASVSSLSLPIANIDGMTWSDEFTKKDIMLNLKHRSLLPNNAEFSWYAGIGVAFISADVSSLTSANGNFGGTVSDSSEYNTASAAADIGLDYRFRLSAAHPHWFAAFDANLQAVYITGEYGHFYVYNGYNTLQTDINGTLLSATLSVSIIYRFGKTEQ